MRHVSKTHRVALDRSFDRTNLDPKIPIKYIDTKNQRADILTKRSFTRDEWNHLLCFFNISHFSSTVFQQDSGEERVKAKSRPLMSLIAKVPSNVSSSTSVSPGKRSYGNQDPWSTNAEKEERPGRPVVGSDRKTASDHYHEQFITSSSSATYSKRDDNHVWSSQEWKTDTEVCERSGRPDINSWRTTRESQPGVSHEETQHDGTAQPVVNEVITCERSGEWKSEVTTYDRSGRPDKTSRRMVPKVQPDHEEILLDGTAQSVKYGETLRDRSGRPDRINSQEVAISQNFVMGNEETELELSVESRSFVNRVNDQMRKRQKRISNVTEDGEKHSMIW